MTLSSISFVEITPQEPSRILQLYPFLELFIEGEPPNNTLFVMEKPPMSILDSAEDRLLIIDPPVATASRFRLEGAVTSIFTGDMRESGIPQLQTQPGGVAHIRMGEHFLDIYSQRGGNIICFPALGIVCSGSFGSDATLPQIAQGSDGSEELDSLRLLAQLVKRNLRLLIPQTGTLVEEPTQAMQRLAEDVGYLHGLRRVVPQLAQRGDTMEDAWQVAESLMPNKRKTPLSVDLHKQNVRQIWSQS